MSAVPPIADVKADIDFCRLGPERSCGRRPRRQSRATRRPAQAPSRFIVGVGNVAILTSPVANRPLQVDVGRLVQGQTKRRQLGKALSAQHVSRAVEAEDILHSLSKQSEPGVSRRVGDLLAFLGARVH